MKLLGIGTDAKTTKGNKFGYLTGILYLAPGNISSHEVCHGRSEGCSKSCLYLAGRGGFSNVQTARINKTKQFFNNRDQFLNDLESDIQRLITKCETLNMKPCVRLNGTSDISWENHAISLMNKYPDVQFYDYTKILGRMLKYCKGEFPSNYHLTFSKTEHNWDACEKVLSAGGNVAVVFSGKLPETYKSYSVIDGDLSDLRFVDPAGSIVGLKAKGPARKDQSGFVVYVV